MASQAFISVSCDLRGFNKWASAAIGRQAPYATARALTRLGKQCQEEVRGLLRPPRFKIHSDFVPKGIRIIPANKKDWPRSQVTVGTKDSFMAMQETGGTKTPPVQPKPLRVPKFPGFLAITTRSVPREALGVPKELRPRKVLAQKRGWVDEQSGTLKLRSEAIYGPTQEKPKTIFFLRKSAKIKPRFGFVGKVTTTAKKHYGDIFVASMQQALETAKH